MPCLLGCLALSFPRFADELDGPSRANLVARLAALAALLDLGLVGQGHARYRRERKRERYGS